MEAITFDPDMTTGPRLLSEAELDEIGGGVIPVGVIWGAVALGTALGVGAAIVYEWWTSR